MSETDPSPLKAYGARVDAGDLSFDQAQENAARALDGLHSALQGYVPDTAPKKAGGLKGLLGLKPKDTAPAPRGIYLWGGVGRGKSMLMNLFYDAAPIHRKRRVHFHAFMQQVHIWMRDIREDKGRDADDPIPAVARAIAERASLLCFDELEINDITDAMIVGRLFETLFDLGVVTVATSNRPPMDLYKDGLQRDAFVPFIELIEERMDVIELASPKDYRLEHLRQMEVYIMPDDDAARANLEATFTRLTRGVKPHAASIPVQGRDVPIPKAAEGVALIRFDDICGRPLGPADYLELARRYHTLIIPGIPQMDKDSSDKARRFVTLIDALYETHVKLICSSDVMPDDLYQGGTAAFAFERTASRLIEMQSEHYMVREHKGRAGGGDL